MRTMLHIHLDTQRGNDAVRNGNLPKRIEALVSELHPEASYFFPDRGRRSALFVFDLAEPSQMPSILEPLLEGLNAEVELTPVMTLGDLQNGLSHLATSS